MSEQELSKKITQEISLDHLDQAKAMIKQVDGKDQSHQEMLEVIQQVADGLNQKYGNQERYDSLCEDALVNYFYLIACSNEYREFLPLFEEGNTLDYESILFKAIELKDIETIGHLIEQKPELLNVMLYQTFKKEKISAYLLRCDWSEPLKKMIYEIKNNSDQEPRLSDESPTFDWVQKSSRKNIQIRR